MYEMVLLNSGSNPARDVSITTDKASLEGALGSEATAENRRKWLACFEPDANIEVIQNGDRTSCSFGYTNGIDGGFWKYGSRIDVDIHYKDWFGRSIIERQTIVIRNSESFTDFSWGERRNYGG